MEGIEGVAFAVELFVISFSFLCWLITPPTQKLPTSQEVHNCEQKQDQEPVQETLKNQEEQPQIKTIPMGDIWEDEAEETIQQPAQNSEFNELQKTLVADICEKMKPLRIKQVRAVAKLLGIKQFENRQSLSKAELMKRIKLFIKTVQIQEQTLLAIKEYF